MTEIDKYFPKLTQEQKEKYSKLVQLYKYWNSKVNLISRKDIDNLEINPILHSLSIVKIVRFKDSTLVMDVGTGPLDRENTTDYPHANGVGHPVYNYNSGNASVNPIFIYPDEEEGIQGTNIEPWSGDITNGSANNSGT